MEQATSLCSKMNDNIDARATLKLLLDYPEREYPEPEPLDAKGKPSLLVTPYNLIYNVLHQVDLKTALISLTNTAIHET